MQNSRRLQYSQDSAIAPNPNKKRIENIFQGFTSKLGKIRYIDHPGLCWVGPKPCARDLEIAAKTGNNLHQKPTIRKIKKKFLALQFKYYCKIIDENPDAILIVWNGQKGHRRLFGAAARKKSRQIFFFEEAPLPDRISIDPVGINFGSSLPKTISFYRRWLDSNPEQVVDLTKFQSQLRSRTSAHRADVTQVNTNEDLTISNYIFCPLQVPGDSQLTIFGDWVTSVQEHIEVIRTASQALPKGWHLRVKEHPSAKIKFTEQIKALEGDNIRLDNKTDTLQQIKNSSGVLTVNSSVGLQSFFYEKPVFVLGHATFGIPEIATRVPDTLSIKRIFSSPESANFSQNDRQAFLSYLISNYYPTEKRVLEGSVQPSDVLSLPHLQFNNLV